MAEWKYVTRLGIQDRIEKLLRILQENDVVKKVLKQHRRRIEHLKKMQEWMNEHSPGASAEKPKAPPVVSGLEGKTKVV
jgi:hypothetical protein